MTLEDLESRLAEVEDRSDQDWALTFVSQGPHGLPIRPELLTEHPNGERVYAMTVRQLRKLIRLYKEQQ